MVKEILVPVDGSRDASRAISFATEWAASYVPKENMAHIATYLQDVLEAKEKGKHITRNISGLRPLPRTHSVAKRSRGKYCTDRLEPPDGASWPPQLDRPCAPTRAGGVH